MNLPQQPINPFEKYLQKSKIQYIPQHINKILDIGCGDGSVFDGTTFQCDGVDPDVESLKLAEKSPNYKNVSTSINLFKPENYDCVTVLGTLEHMAEIDIDYLMDYISTAKAIYITVPNANSFHRVIGKNLGIIPNTTHLQKHDYDIGHKRYYDSNLLVEHTYNILKYQGFYIAGIGSTGFKWDTSGGMLQYLADMQIIEKSAKFCDFIGYNKFHGAELFIYLCKN